jgi:spore maturation protein CgeB
MKIVLFCHSILSDWNHGNAHFLRGLATELADRGHDLSIYEPVNSWSLHNLRREHGDAAIDETLRWYPLIDVVRYAPETFELDEALEGADLVLVHEWNAPELVDAVGAARARGAPFRALFHDTHHRSVTAPDEMNRFDLSGYDGVLAFGQVVRERYITAGWADRVWAWHEAADPRVFRPLPDVSKEADLVWIGNWGNENRARELQEFLLEPVARLHLDASVYGARYPEAAQDAVERSGARYRGYLPNYRVPEAFARHRVTLHIPGRPYAEALPGIPTIRVFEALCCGIPLLSAPWTDTEELFRPGRDFLVARSGTEMQRHLRSVLCDPALAAELSASGRRAVLHRHTISHRVDELLSIAASLGVAEARRGRATRPRAPSPVEYA